VATKVYQYDVGTFLNFYTGMDLSVGDVTLKVRKPDGTEESWGGEVLDTLTLKRITTAGDLDQVGIYKFQVFIDAPALHLHSSTVELEVYVKPK
jgi:hypothetical protein